MSISILKTLSNPRFLTKDKAVVQFEAVHNSEPATFNARRDDVEAHGRKVYDDALAGHYGVIGEPADDAAAAPPPLTAGLAAMPNV